MHPLRFHERENYLDPDDLVVSSGDSLLLADGDFPHNHQQSHPGVVPLLVVGAGPHGLALVSKLLEATVDPLEEAPHNTTLFRRRRAQPRQLQLQEQQRPSSTAGKTSTMLPSLTSSSAEWLRPQLIPSTKFDTMSDANMGRLVARAKASKKEHAQLLQNIVVIDKTGDGWLTQWDAQFRALEIPHLRSGITAHPCPIHMQTLDMFALMTGKRETGVVPLDLRRGGGYEGPFDAPKTELFRDFVDSVVSRYSLADAVRTASVDSIQPVWTADNAQAPVGDLSSLPPATSCSTSSTACDDVRQFGAAAAAINITNPKPPGPADAGGSADVDGPDAIPQRPHIFKVRLSTGQILRAANVVVAHGPLNQPVFPDFCCDLQQDEIKAARAAGTLVHSVDLMGAGCAPPSSTCVANGGRILIVGGGLTAGHLAIRALNQVAGNGACGDGFRGTGSHGGCEGASVLGSDGPGVVLCCRRALVERQYDLELRWMGRQRHQYLAKEFWPLSDRERLALLRSAKGGGSVTPEVMQTLSRYVWMQGCFGIYCLK